jgi:hypothetical protein
MTRTEWQALVDRTFAEVNGITATKGAEYTHGSDDQLDNFKQNAIDLGLSPFAVWAVPFDKHVRSIKAFCAEAIRRGTSVYIDDDASEPIEGRILDAIVYLLLLRALVLDEYNSDCSLLETTDSKHADRQFVRSMGGVVEVLNPQPPAPDSEGGEP